MPGPHPQEFRRRAVELARELDEHGNRRHPIAQVARDLEISELFLRNWLRPKEVETGERPGLTKAEREELVRLRSENRTLRMEQTPSRSSTTSNAATRPPACSPLHLRPSRPHEPCGMISITTPNPSGEPGKLHIKPHMEHQQ